MKRTFFFIFYASLCYINIGCDLCYYCEQESEPLYQLQRQIKSIYTRYDTTGAVTSTGESSIFWDGNKRYNSLSDTKPIHYNNYGFIVYSSSIPWGDSTESYLNENIWTRDKWKILTYYYIGYWYDSWYGEWNEEEISFTYIWDGLNYERYDEYNNLLSFGIYEKPNMLSEITSLRSDGTTSNTSNYEYDGWKVQRQYTNGILYKDYQWNGNTCLVTYYDLETGEVRYQASLEYGAKQELLTYTELRDNGTTVIKYEYIYDYDNPFKPYN